MKSIVSIGNIEEISILESLVYYDALKVLTKDIKGTRITIDLSSFYTMEAVELHDFVNTLTYRFVEENNEQILVYSICSRPYEIYKEVQFNGEIIFSSLDDIELGIGPSVLAEARRNKYLSI